MQTSNIIYALYCPIAMNPVYVGQTKKGLDRPFEHIKEKSHSKKVNTWVHLLKASGREPIIVVLDYGVDLSLLEAKEKFWIDYFIAKGYSLLNSMHVTPLVLQDLEFSKLDDNDPLYDIRVYVKSRRMALNLTQPELCEKSGVGLRFIREMETGYKTNFNTDSIVKLLNCLGRTKLTLKAIE